MMNVINSRTRACVQRIAILLAVAACQDSPVPDRSLPLTIFPSPLVAGRVSATISSVSRSPDGTLNLQYHISHADSTGAIAFSNPVPLTLQFWTRSVRTVGQGDPDHVRRVNVPKSFTNRQSTGARYFLSAQVPAGADSVSVALAGTGVSTSRLAIPPVP